jgi:hypothetical protein
MCVYIRGRCNSDYLDFSYARLWTNHKPIKTKDEGYRANTNKGYTISKWDIRE